MWKQKMPGLRMTVLLTALIGLIYPGVVTGICQVLFPAQSNGSLLVRDGKVVGSVLIGQNFTKPEYFQPRPSAAGSDGYDASTSSGLNLGPASQKLMDRVKASVTDLKVRNPRHAGEWPADMASASGLDPQISPAAARVQIERVAQARATSPERVGALVAEFTEGHDLGFVEEPRVNVLLLNLAMDRELNAK